MSVIKPAPNLFFRIICSLVGSLLPFVISKLVLIYVYPISLPGVDVPMYLSFFFVLFWGINLRSERRARKVVTYGLVSYGILLIVTIVVMVKFTVPVRVPQFGAAFYCLVGGTDDLSPKGKKLRQTIIDKYGYLPKSEDLIEEAGFRSVSDANAMISELWGDSFKWVEGAVILVYTVLYCLASLVLTCYGYLWALSLTVSGPKISRKTV